MNCLLNDEHCVSVTGAVVKLKAEIEGLHMQMTDKSSQLDHLNAELCEKKMELDNLKAESSRLQEELDVSGDVVKKLELQLQMSTHLVEELKVSLSSANKEKQRLEKMAFEYKEKEELLAAENLRLEESLEMLGAQRQDEIQPITASCYLVADNLAQWSDTSDQRTDGCKSEVVSGSSLLPENAQASDANLIVKEENCAQVGCDLVQSHASTEQSSDINGELKACREELENLQLTVLEREKSYCDHIARLTAELESVRSNASCNDCSSKDRLIEDLNKTTQLLEDDRLQLVGDLESCQGEFEDQKAEIIHLRQQVEELTTKLCHADEQPTAISHVDNVIGNLRVEIEWLRESMDEKESVCQLYESEVERLTGVEDRLTKEIEMQQEIINSLPQEVDSGSSTNIPDEVSMFRDQLLARERELKEVKEENFRLNQRVDELSADVERLQQKLELTAANNNARPCSDSDVNVGNPNVETDSTVVFENSTEASSTKPQIDEGCHRVNGHVSSDAKEIVQLHSTVSQQKEMLDALNSKYASVLGLLEDRSQTQHGSSLLPDLHQFEVELREVRADRERLLSVLNEKTREASGLRAEVHRLTSVAAASQAALTKVQRDAQQIATQSQQEPNQDMKNEAVKRLSQMIKDKDLEIDALQLKNATLVQVSWFNKSLFYS